MGLWLHPNRVVRALTHALGGFPGGFGGVCQRDQVTEPAAAVDVYHRRNLVIIDLFGQMFGPQQPHLLAADSDDANAPVQFLICLGEQPRCGENRRDATAVVERPFRNVVPVVVGEQQQFLVGLWPKPGVNVLALCRDGLGVDREPDPGAVVREVGEPRPRLLADADRWRLRLAAEGERAGRRKLAGHVVDEDEPHRALLDGVTELLHPVDESPTVRRRGGGDDDLPLDVEFINLVGGSVAGVDQVARYLTSRRVRQRNGLERSFSRSEEVE